MRTISDEVYSWVQQRNTSVDHFFVFPGVKGKAVLIDLRCLILVQNIDPVIRGFEGRGTVLDAIAVSEVVAPPMFPPVAERRTQSEGILILIRPKRGVDGTAAAAEERGRNPPLRLDIVGC